MSAAAQAEQVLGQSELAYVADVLERIRPVPHAGSLIRQWVRDPSGGQPLVCIWVHQPGAGMKAPTPTGRRRPQSPG